ncbi:MAG: DUF3379 domain-containing protein [Xanthomonadaceae bacterium]|nr:DUF3379 domain-containing protein [Xanthomonadaceae bacterium]
MECLEFRRRLLENPRDQTAALSAHRLGCRACSEWAAQAQAFDVRLRRALDVPVPDGLAEKVMMEATWKPVRRRRWYAFAASAAAVTLAATLIAVQLWQGAPLADTVVQHLYHEPELLMIEDGAVTDTQLRAVLQRVGSRLDGDIGRVIHAGLCPIAGRLAAHLVVQGTHGPVAVIVMPRNGIDTVTPVRDGALHGSVVPIARGSVAIVGFDGEDLDALVERVRAGLVQEA